MPCIERSARKLLQFLVNEFGSEHFDVEELIEETGELPGCGSAYKIPKSNLERWHTRDASTVFVPDPEFPERVRKVIDHLEEHGYLSKVDLAGTRYELALNSIQMFGESDEDSE